VAFDKPKIDPVVRTPFYVAALTLVLLAASPQAGLGMLALSVLAKLVIESRRSRVALREGGIAVDSLFGLAKRWVPFSAIDALSVEGRELLARDDQGKVLFRNRESEQKPWLETFTHIDRQRAAMDPTPTGFERTVPGLEAWLAAIDARANEPAGPAYRGQPFSWERTLEIFRSSSRSAEVRAGAAWALLGSSDASHRSAVLDAASPTLPPLLLAVCALHPAAGVYLPLARRSLRYLGRADRREWKRLASRKAA